MHKVQSIQLKGIILLLSFFISLIVSGQGHVIFEQLSSKDGLSNGTINSIFKDNRGFMWFCTDDGLNKYDGYNFTVYKSELSDIITTQNLQFLNVVEDSYGNIWVGTTEGLYFYDEDNDRIVQFSKLPNIDLKNTPLNGAINCLLFDTFNYLWIGTYTGISRIKISNPDIRTIKKEDITIFTSDTNNLQHLSSNNIFSFYEDKQHQIWVSSNSDQLEYFNYEKNKFIQYRIEIPGINKWNILNKTIKADRKDNFWIATRGFGLIYWDRKKQTFTQFKTLSFDKKNIDISNIQSLMIDKLDRIWIGTDGNGLVVFDRNKNEINHYNKNIDDHSMLSSNAVYSIFEDPKGIVWVGTYLMGLNKFVSDKLNFGTFYSSPYSKTGLSHNIVTGFCEDKNNKIWITTDGGGLNEFDRKTLQFKHYIHEPGNPASLSINSTITPFCDRENNIWVGTYNGGLNRFDQKTQRFYHFWHNPGDSTTISSNHTWSFAQDKSNNLWVATVDGGIDLMKSGTKLFITYTNRDRNVNRPDEICSSSITKLFIDKKNILWIGTEYGLDMVDLNQVDFSLPIPKLVFKHYMPSENKNSLSYYRISCMNEDNLDNLWIGTKGGGLNKLDLKTQNFTRYTVKDGLPHGVINGILFDSDNNLWISTNNGLSNLDIKTKKFKNYSTSDGLQSTVFVKTSCFKTSDGMFLFGGINGFNAFFPEKITSKKSELNAVITDFKLFNQSVAVGTKINKRILLPNPIYVLNKINLFFKENSFAFEFSALDYSNPEKIYYSYKLKGFDQVWQTTDAKMRVAKYTNLSPGEYIFCVKASSNSEVWPDSETSISISILPPWWKTLWFKITAIILFITIWILFFSVRVYNLEKQKSILKSKVEEKTKQLKIANEQLSESNMMKDKFLTIIAHDLINPFNTILGFTDLLLTNYSNWNDQSRIETIKTINESSNDLYDLLGNLLQWSRSERGLLEYSPEKIDLNKCILQITSLLSVTANSKNINIEVKISEECCQVKSDIQLLNAILRNLISNSIKFTPVDGHITIQTECRAKNILVSVIDNGIGISKEKLENLFRIDVQHSTLGTNNEKGTGLGLFLVKEFVTKQQGTLTIKSEPGKGSAFSFTVPLWVEKA